jgi:hypothetical protein
MGRLAAGVKVSLIFGVVWSVMVTLAVFGISVVTGSQLTLANYALVMLFYTVLGAIQGVVVAAGMAWSGERRGLTVDTYPRLLGGAIGFITGAAGTLFVVVNELWGGAMAIWQAIPWVIVGLVGAFGGLATVTLLTIARRGSLPPSPTEPGQIGR